MVENAYNYILKGEIYRWAWVLAASSYSIVLLATIFNIR